MLSAASLVKQLNSFGPKYMEAKNYDKLCNWVRKTYPWIKESSLKREIRKQRNKPSDMEKKAPFLVFNWEK